MNQTGDVLCFYTVSDYKFKTLIAVCTQNMAKNKCFTQYHNQTADGVLKALAGPKNPSCGYWPIVP